MLRSYIQRWSIIKNSAVEDSDERAIDAFTLGLQRGDLVKRMGRIRPKTVSNLMDIANRFADGKDACNKKKQDHLKTTGETDTAVKGGDLAIMTTMALTAK
jgi:hypothetical protein